MRFTAGHHVYFSNLLISIAAAAMCWQASVVLRPDAKSAANHAALFLFLATYAFYGIHDIYTKTGKNGEGNMLPRAQYWQRYHHTLRIPVLLACLASLAAALLIPWRQLLMAFSLPFLLAISYTFPILPMQQLQRWKNQALFKIVVLAGVWTAVTTLLLPVNLMDANTWIFLAGRFLFMLLICIPFDVRDAAFDKSLMRGKTLIDFAGGISRLIRISIGTCMAAILCWLLLWQQNTVCFVTATTAAMHLAFTCWLCIEAMKDPQPVGRYIWIDAQMIVQSIIIGASMWLAYIRF